MLSREKIGTTLLTNLVWVIVAYISIYGYEVDNEKDMLQFGYDCLVRQ